MGFVKIVSARSVAVLFGEFPEEYWGGVFDDFGPVWTEIDIPSWGGRLRFDRTSSREGEFEFSPSWEWSIRESYFSILFKEMEETGEVFVPPVPETAIVSSRAVARELVGWYYV